MTVVAGPGFGKTSLLVDAFADVAEGDVQGWLTCGPEHSDASVLADDIAESIGVDRGGDLRALVRAVWLRAPARVCFVLDDVHEIPDGSDGAEWLSRLVAELPQNGHVVLASRAPVRAPAARLAGKRQLERLVESDLVFDHDELRQFAAARNVSASVLASTGGWPALAELTAAAAEDLVFEYVWEEILVGLGRTRAVDLARLAAVGGGDDDVVHAIGSGVTTAAELVADVPLVETRAGGWVRLHPLWEPVLRPLLTAAQAAEARRAAAAAHRRLGRFDRAIPLYADASAWDEILVTMREAALTSTDRLDGRVFGRWHALLPADHRTHPVARLAQAVAIAWRLPDEARGAFEAARAGLAELGDIETEVVVLREYGHVLWWANDGIGLLTLHARGAELAAAGSEAARVLTRIGEAALAHIVGDSDATLDALSGIDDERARSWMPLVCWFRHVAFRRRGELDRAELALDASPDDGGWIDPQKRLARHRTAWLRGHVGDALDGMREIEAYYRDLDNTYLHAESTIELAAHVAWLGDRGEAVRLLHNVERTLADMPGALVRILSLIASTALAVDDDDEPRAAAILADDPFARPEANEAWFWLDRAAVAIPYVLFPDQREAWAARVRAPAHRIGVELADALIAVRRGDTAPMSRLVWPEPGLARVNLPRRWLAELVVAGTAVGNPPPGELLDMVATGAREALVTIAEGPSPALARAAAVIERQLTAAPNVRVNVLGALSVQRDGQPVDHPELRRQRVRELLCFLVAHRRVRRDVVADALWPDLLDARHNLRVTLNYLQHVLEPDRPKHEPSSHLTTTTDTLIFQPGPRLQCDLWELERLLDLADKAEREGHPEAALAAYHSALPLWRGAPYDDVVSDWARDERSRWLRRYLAAAVRTGDLLLASGDTTGAIEAAGHALRADSSDERSYQLLARAHLADDDPHRSRSALEQCLVALDVLGVRPSTSTLGLMRSSGMGDRLDGPHDLAG